MQKHAIRTFVKTPVPKNAMTGMIAMMPMSPTQSSIECAKHNNAMVTMHIMDTHHCLMEKRSFEGRIDLISRSPSPVGRCVGRYDMRSSAQMRTMDTAETGSATANQRPQSICGFISWRAIKFWGEEIGDDCPPIFAARAIAI